MLVKAVYIFLVFIALVNGKSKTKDFFFRGRVPSGSFEYSDLNGFYTPKKAIKVCENDLSCAGFTFKGTPHIKSAKYEIFFFHYIPKKLFDEVKMKKNYFHWTTYKVKSRNFVKLDNHIVHSDQTSNKCPQR